MSAPKKYNKTPIDLDRVEALAKIGMNYTQIAGALGVSGSTLDRRKVENPLIEQAYRAGKSTGIAAVCEKVYEQALAGEAAAQKLWLQSTASWLQQQKAAVELTVNSTPGIDIILSSEKGALDGTVEQSEENDVVIDGLREARKLTI